MADDKETQVEQPFRLKDTETGFYDDESKLTVTRDEVVRIGPGAGAKTVRMIATGGLVRVDSAEAEAAAAGPQPRGAKADRLPESFPHYEKLAAAGYTTTQSLKGVTADELRRKGLTKAEAEEVVGLVK